MHSEDVDSLQWYQSKLVELLRSDMTPQEIIVTVTSSPNLRLHAPDVEEWKPEMIKRAQELVRKWGRTE